MDRTALAGIRWTDRTFPDHATSIFSQVRLARAVDLMGRGVPLAEVAAQVGYAAPAAFSTMFKRALGVPPSRFTLSPEPA